MTGVRLLVAAFFAAFVVGGPELAAGFARVIAGPLEGTVDLLPGISWSAMPMLAVGLVVGAAIGLLIHLAAYGERKGSFDA